MKPIIKVNNDETFEIYQIFVEGLNIKSNLIRISLMSTPYTQRRV